jgi:hypothetical protein
MSEEYHPLETKTRLVFCTGCGEQYWASERCPFCAARPKLFYDRLGISRFLMDHEYGSEW